MRKWRRVALLSVFVVPALLFAESAPSGAARPSAKPTGSTLNIGVIATLSGPQAPSSRQAGTVAVAWQNWVNKKLGGIANHPVKVFVKDDGSDPTKGQAAEKDLVDGNNVIAILGGTDNVLPAWDDDALSKHIAIVSGSANSTDWYQKPGLFPTPTDVLSGLTGQAEVAIKFGKAKKFADLYCAEIAACQMADPFLKKGTDKAGIGFTSLAISSTASSYTAECLKLQQQNVDYAQLNFSADAAVKFVQDCQTQGYNPTWGSSEQAISTAFLKLRNLKLYGPAYAFPSTANNPRVAEFRKVMSKYAKGKDWREGSGSFAWGGLEFLRKAMANLGDNPTREDVLAGIYALKDEDLGGLLPNKLTFTEGAAIGFGKAPCYFVVGVKNGKVVAPTNLDPQCPAAS